MITGLSCKMLLFSLQKLEVTSIIHQMIFLNLCFSFWEKNVEEEKYAYKNTFCLLFSMVHISTNLLLDGIKFGV